MDPVELLMRKRVSSAFIGAYAIKVQFKREIKVRTAAGGYTKSLVTLENCQIARIIPSKRRYAYIGVNTEAGEIPHWPYILEGHPDMDIEQGDRFTWNDEEYQVKSIEPTRDEKTIAAIDFYGKNTSPTVALTS